MTRVAAAADEMVWGNDREITTYDNAGGCYMGPIKAYEQHGFELTATGSARSSECIGGAIVVLNGPGPFSASLSASVHS